MQAGGAHRGYGVEQAALALLIVVKLALLAWFGPTWEPDWGGYSQFANHILAERGWRFDAELALDPSPLTLFRTIGYPALVALFRGLMGDGPAHLYAIVVVQFAFSIAATVAVWHLALALLGGRRAALLAAAGFATGLTVLYDQSLLTDSLYNSLFILGWAVPLIAVLRRRPVHFGILAGLGLLTGFTCLQRGTGLMFSVFVLVPVTAWAWRGGRGRVRALAVVAFLAPVAVLAGGTMAWNAMRTGQWIMSTGAQYVLIQPMVKAAGRGHAVFDGDTPIDALAAKYLKTYEYDEVGLIVNGLFQEYGLNAIQSAELHKKVFVRAWLRHPLAMGENMINNFNNSLIFQFFDPLDCAFFYSRLVTGDRLFPGFAAAWKQVRGGDPLPLAAIVAVTLFRAVAYLSVAVLILGGPVLGWRAWRRRALSETEAVVLGLWLLFFGYTMTLCAIHMVGRFLPAALPAGLIVVLYCVGRLRVAATRKVPA